MKAICTHRCQYRGHSIKKGDILDFEPRQATDQVRASFKPLEGTWPDAAKVPDSDDGKKPEEPAIKTRPLPIAEIKRRLDEIGIKYPSRATQAELEDLYMAQVNATTVTPEG